tara:strand:- start:2299 stop:3390 length:1092 start_codon:yes stop_codon:yes gene_type:complete
MTFLANMPGSLQSLCEQFISELEELPNLQVVAHWPEESFPGDRVISFVLEVLSRETPFKISVAVKTGPVHPKQTLRIVREMLGVDVDNCTMLIAPSLSKSSRELLRQHGFGFWDTSGSLYLELPNALYSVERPPLPQPREGREPRHIFKGSTAQVIHTLLLDPAREWKVTRLAEEADVSAFTSQKTLDYLEKQLWVSKTGRGPHTVRHVKKPGAILDAWAKDYEMENQSLRFHQFAPNIEAQKVQLASFMSNIDDSSWAVTLEHGAEAYAPLLTKLPSVLTVVVPEELAYHLRQAAQESGFREVPSGENLRILTTNERSPFLGRRKFDSIWVASPIQLYLDLHSWPRRGKEQAEHLRKERIKF